MNACPEEWVLAALAEGQALPEREPVLAHAADCPRCLEALADLSAPAEALSAQAEGIVMGGLRRPRWMPFAAAAALLLAVGLFFLRPRDAAVPAAPPPVLPAVTGVSPFQDDLALSLGQATAVALRPGSRATRVSSHALSLETGAAWIENPGEPVEILLPGGRVSVTKAMLLVENAPEEKGALWLREAAAAEGVSRVLVLSGSALVHAEGGESAAIKAGQEMRLGAAGLAGPFVATAPAWKGNGWEHPERLPAPFRDRTLDLIPGALKEPYVWEAVLRRKDPQAAAGVRFLAEGRCWELPLGNALGGTAGWLRVRVEARGSWVRIHAGSREALKAPVASLPERLDTVSGGAGLRAWGGDVELLEVRWRTGS